MLSFKLDESSRGTNYAQGTNVASTGGSGSGATFDINRVRSNGSLYREFETEYTSVSETTANTFTNDGKDATTIAAERYAITNEASGVTFNYVLPSILTEANTLPSGSKSIAFMVRSGSDPALDKSTFRASTSLTATMNNYARPVTKDYASESYSNFRATKEGVDHWLLPDNTMFASFEKPASDSATVSLKLSLSDSVVPRYNVMRKPTLNSKADVSVTTAAADTSEELHTTLTSYTTSNCDHLLLFTDRNDIGGTSANDRATAFEDRAIVDMSEQGVKSSYGEATRVPPSSADSTRRQTGRVT